MYTYLHHCIATSYNYKIFCNTENVKGRRRKKKKKELYRAYVYTYLISLYILVAHVQFFVVNNTIRY